MKENSEAIFYFGGLDMNYVKKEEIMKYVTYHQSALIDSGTSCSTVLVAMFKTKRVRVQNYAPDCCIVPSSRLYLFLQKLDESQAIFNTKLERLQIDDILPLRDAFLHCYQSNMNTNHNQELFVRQLSEKILESKKQIFNSLYELIT